MPNDLLYPEATLAEKVVLSYELSPPIDIFKLVNKFADIEEDLIPGQVDGVSVNRKPRPLIVINSMLTSTRKVFTLAHELAHVIIPWHCGTFSCRIDADITSTLRDYIYEQVEAEANRFAAELLVPSCRLHQAVAQKETVDEKLKYIIANTGVSPQAASISLHKFLDPGYVVVLEKNGNVIIAIRSDGTLVDMPIRGMRLDIAPYDQFCSSSGFSAISSYNVYWWYFAKRRNINYTSDSRSWRDILGAILTSYYRN